MPDGEAGLTQELTTQDITTWAGLEEAFRAGGTITLTQDITAASGDDFLTVPDECEVDKFSTFMIAYKDDSASGNSGTSGNSGASSSGSASAQAATPKTGDSIPTVFPVAVALGAVALLLLAIKKRREQ